jgi:hypothetical protein
MTPEAAIHKWMNGFGIPAYPHTSAPEEGDEEWAGYHYMTYELAIGKWDGSELNLPVNVWYRTESEAAPNAKVREIRDALKHGGAMIQCDGGALWLKQGSPWAQAIREEGDNKIKRRYVNINVEYLLTD